MRLRGPLFVVSAVAMLAIGSAGSAEQNPVPLFTSEDLDRMFGPAPAQPRDPVDKSGPEDWRWVESFLDRQYARIEADRQFELRSRQVDISATRIDEPARIYGGSSIWGRGYPALAWWNGAGRWSMPRGGHANRACARCK